MALQFGSKSKAFNKKAVVRRGALDPFDLVTISEFGASRIAWGSNFPATEGTLKGLLQDTQSVLVDASESDREWIFHKTSEILYPALKSQAK